MSFRQFKRKVAGYCRPAGVRKIVFWIDEKGRYRANAAGTPFVGNPISKAIGVIRPGGGFIYA